jgi:hypothetical protein
MGNTIFGTLTRGRKVN